MFMGTVALRSAVSVAFRSRRRSWVRGHSELAREKCELVGAWQTRLGLVTNVDWGQHDPVVAKLHTARWSCCSKDAVSAMSYTRKPPGRPRLASL